jgi:hypothetical protein
LDDIRIDPAFNALTLPPGFDQAGAVQLFEVVGNGGRRYAQVAAQVADTLVSLIRGTAGNAPCPTAGQARENLQPVGIGQGLEHLSITLGGYITMFRHN